MSRIADQGGDGVEGVLTFGTQFLTGVGADGANQALHEEGAHAEQEDAEDSGHDQEFDEGVAGLLSLSHAS